MEFLKEYNITNEEIDIIVENNSDGVLRNIKMNEHGVREVVDYLMDLGITVDTLKDLFVYQIGIFFKTKEEIQRVFDEYELDSIVKSLNYDVNTVDMIEFS